MVNITNALFSVVSVVTEVSEIPPTSVSVPVILRLHNRDHAGLELEAET